MMRDANWPERARVTGYTIRRALNGETLEIVRHREDGSQEVADQAYGVDAARTLARLCEIEDLLLNRDR